MAPTSQAGYPKTTGNRTYVEYINKTTGDIIKVKSVHDVEFQGDGNGKFIITIRQERSQNQVDNTTPAAVSQPRTPVLKPQTIDDRHLSPRNLNDRFNAVADVTDAVADVTDAVAGETDAVADVTDAVAEKTDAVPDKTDAVAAFVDAYAAFVADKTDADSHAFDAFAAAAAAFAAVGAATNDFDAFDAFTAAAAAFAAASVADNTDAVADKTDAVLDKTDAVAEINEHVSTDAMQHEWSKVHYALNWLGSMRQALKIRNEKKKEERVVRLLTIYPEVKDVLDDHMTRNSEINRLMTKVLMSYVKERPKQLRAW